MTTSLTWALSGPAGVLGGDITHPQEIRNQVDYHTELVRWLQALLVAWDWLFVGGAFVRGSVLLVPISLPFA